MKILLVEPAKSPVTIGGEDAFLYEPLALEYVAAGVAQDHDVRILDLRLEKDADLPDLQARGNRFYKRLRNAYRDYSQIGMTGD